MTALARPRVVLADVRARVSAYTPTAAKVSVPVNRQAKQSVDMLGVVTDVATVRDGAADIHVIAIEA